MLAWVCRRLCSVAAMPAAHRLPHSFVTAFGDRVEPSPRQTRMLVGLAQPEGQATLLLCPPMLPQLRDGGGGQGDGPPAVLGLRRFEHQPARLVCSSERSTRNRAPSRSTSCHRSASISPRRMPVPSAIVAIA